MQAEEVSIVEQAADHFLRDLGGAHLVQLVAIAFQSGIKSKHRGFHAGLDERR